TMQQPVRRRRKWRPHGRHPRARQAVCLRRWRDCARGHRSWRMRLPNSTASLMKPSCRRAGWGSELSVW
ncbi:hypothetical protein M9458_015688, partial [Cirrhinus mrigala]